MLNNGGLCLLFPTKEKLISELFKNVLKLLLSKKLKN